MRIVVTGAAGFIGFHTAKRLLDDGHEVWGYDGVTSYYEPRLKRDRLEILATREHWNFVEAMLEDSATLNEFIEEAQADVVIHLAAQAGVRYSIDHPESYVSSNLVGTFNLLEALRAHPPKHFLFASTSSVYGANEELPFREVDRTDFPMSFYAATKRACESMTHSYSHLFGIPTTCFRFFTVYGPWGRPDMALFKFVDAIRRGEPIDIYGGGEMSRDFTYIDDLVESIVRLADKIPVTDAPVSPADSVSPVAPWRIVSIAGGNGVGLMEFVAAVETASGATAIKNFLPMQLGDVRDTSADPSLLRDLTGSVPATPVAQGVEAFVEWYRSYEGSQAGTADFGGRGLS